MELRTHCGFETIAGRNKCQPSHLHAPLAETEDLRDRDEVWRFGGCANSRPTNVPVCGGSTARSTTAGFRAALRHHISLLGARRIPQDLTQLPRLQVEAMLELRALGAGAMKERDRGDDQP